MIYKIDHALLNRGPWRSERGRKRVQTCRANGRRESERASSRVEGVALVLHCTRYFTQIVFRTLLNIAQTS